MVMVMMMMVMDKPAQRMRLTDRQMLYLLSI